jgi:hypothetical protein
MPKRNKTNTETNQKRNTKRRNVEIHKPNIPIRPIINWRNAPGYKVAKHLTKLLQNYLDLPYTYNAHNSTHLMTHLKTIDLNSDTSICSFDIKNMYTNIPRKDIINITNNVLENNIQIEVSTQKEIIHIMRIIMKQNYYQFEQQYYEQTEGLAIGAPVSAILVDIFIQYMEHKHIYPILRTREIVAYYRYVDDILVTYGQHKTNIEQTLEEFNDIQPTIKCMIEREQKEKINYLDIITPKK